MSGRVWLREGDGVVLSSGVLRIGPSTMLFPFRWPMPRLRKRSRPQDPMEEHLAEYGSVMMTVSGVASVSTLQMALRLEVELEDEDVLLLLELERTLRQQAVNLGCPPSFEDSLEEMQDEWDHALWNQLLSGRSRWYPMVRKTRTVGKGQMHIVVQPWTRVLDECDHSILATELYSKLHGQFVTVTLEISGLANITNFEHNNHRSNVCVIRSALEVKRGWNWIPATKPFWQFFQRQLVLTNDTLTTDVFALFPPELWNIVLDFAARTPTLAVQRHHPAKRLTDAPNTSALPAAVDQE